VAPLEVVIGIQIVAAEVIVSTPIAREVVVINVDVATTTTITVNVPVSIVVN
jgi:hypothetical protein